MIKLLVSLPRQITIACSGGVDSMAAVDFLRRRHDVAIAFFNHGTATSAAAESFLADYARWEGIPFQTNQTVQDRQPKESLESHWRRIRYDWLHALEGTVVTAHHLDDAVETWVWSSLHGQSKLPGIRYHNVLRPFMLTPKSQLISWCQRNDVPWIEDDTNTDTRYTRNLIRHEMMPHVLRVNPGIHKMVRKRLQAAAKEL
jgi:tRNA(Ile)-lysidine synthetase-like protein